MPYASKDRQKEYQRNWVAKSRTDWLEKNGPCVKCGSTERLEVDHVSRYGKVDHKVWSWSKEKRAVELSKCQVLCHECHIKKTSLENTKPLVHGTVGGYSKGCRCDECRKEKVKQVSEWRSRIKFSATCLVKN